jgi:hypothetical protein
MTGFTSLSRLTQIAIFLARNCPARGRRVQVALRASLRNAA